MDEGEFLIYRILRKIKREIHSKIEDNYLKKFLDDNIYGIYNFTKDDLNLYKTEKKTILLKMNYLKYDNTLELITIGNRSIYWPSGIDNRDLPWLYHEIFDEFTKNPSSYDHIYMKIDDASWIIDAGCSEGYFTLFAFEKNNNAKVVALEPLSEMQEALSKTFESETKSNRFFLEKKALGTNNNTIQFIFNPEHLCDSSINHTTKNIENSNVYDVEVTTLDKLSENHNLFENGIIKMDIEGAEMDALRGGVELMKKYKPRLAVAVYHDYENAIKCRDIILEANPSYKVEFRGMYGYFKPPRPYMLFAW